jgi:hypothetical protein
MAALTVTAEKSKATSSRSSGRVAKLTGHSAVELSEGVTSLLVLFDTEQRDLPSMGLMAALTAAFFCSSAHDNTR